MFQHAIDENTMNASLLIILPAQDGLETETTGHSDDSFQH